DDDDRRFDVGRFLVLRRGESPAPAAGEHDDDAADGPGGDQGGRRRGEAMNARAMTVAFAALVAGCGPSSGSSTNGPPGCLQAQPCGGDGVGAWNLLGAATSPAFFTELNSQLQTACPGASVSAFNVDISGTVIYNADL